MKQKNIFAFTFAELMVIIFLLLILGLFSFIAYNGHVSTARDSNRIAQ
jgi:Tfp pilus assembly protein PilE